MSAQDTPLPDEPGAQDAEDTARAAVLREAADVAASRAGCPCNTAEQIAYLLRRQAAEAVRDA
ncbi:hypothetical protein ACMA1D_02155 [Streptomyces sp. 796.1]|uniref:hypothetical protein n=1 Tax=Streptomyces sp. 796.1 TaxID=3163029 RepID=UPI0039C934C0